MCSRAELLRCGLTLRHDEHVIGQYATITDQYPFRLQAILDFLAAEAIPLDSLQAIVGRGGLLRPIEGGTYAVSEPMLKDLRESQMGQHASNLGGILAHELSQRCGAPAFIVDPVVVDELEPIARLSGLPELPRVSIFHALNHKAVAHRAAHDLGGKYTDFNFIIAHLGGGISVAAHRRGRVIDVNNALNGEGLVHPERSGTPPAASLSISRLLRPFHPGLRSGEEDHRAKGRRASPAPTICGKVAQRVEAERRGGGLALDDIIDARRYPRHQRSPRPGGRHYPDPRHRPRRVISFMWIGASGTSPRCARLPRRR